MKSIALLLAIGLHGVICAPDISLVSAKNFQGYDYPKPNIPFDEPTRPPAIVTKAYVAETPKPTYLPPTPPPSTYLPPDTTRTTTTTTTTRRPTTTTQRPTPAVKKQEVKEGYDYPTPAIPFNLPIETTRAPVKIVVKAVETPQPTYLPPTTRATTRPTTTTTRATTTTTTTRRPTTTTPRPTPALKKGYDYPVPAVPFELPTKVKAVDVNYLPPASTYLPPETTRATTTTTRATTTTTKRTTTTPRPTPALKIKEEAKGYDYPVPKVPFELPPKVKAVEETYLPPPPSTYLPPQTTRATTTTTRATTTTTTTRRPTTTTQRPTPALKIKEVAEGYDYPKPAIPFEIPPKVKAVEVTYLPPTTTTTRATTTTTTTKRTTTTPRPTPALKKGYDYPVPEIPFELPRKIEVTYLPPTTVAVTRPPTTTTRATTTTTRRTTTRPTPAVKKQEVAEGYDYPKPAIPFEIPPKVKAVEVTYLPPPSTYLPPATTRATTTTTRATTTTTTTRRPTTTTQRPTPALKIKEEAKGYDYPVPEKKLELPPKVKAVEVTYLPPPSTYLPPATTRATTTTTRATTTTTKRTTTTQRPTPALKIKEDAKGYDYPVPEKKLELPTKVKAVADSYLPPTTPPPVYLPPVTTTTTRATTTTRRTTTTPRTTTTVRTTPAVDIDVRFDDEEPKGYDYPVPAKKLILPTKPAVRIAVKAEPPKQEYLPPATTRATTTTTTTTPAPTYLPPEEPKGYDYPKPAIPFFY